MAMASTRSGGAGGPEAGDDDALAPPRRWWCCRACAAMLPAADAVSRLLQQARQAARASIHVRARLPGPGPLDLCKLSSAGAGGRAAR